MKPINPRPSLILDATITAIRTLQDWTTLDVAAALSIPKSALYHYFNSKSELMRAAWDRYATQARNACDLTIDIAMWVAMRHDPDLAREIRRQRAAERASLQIEFDGWREAWLAQALHVGLGVMRESGVQVDEEMIRKLFKELVFENHVRSKTPEAKAGVDQELSV